MVRVLYAVHTKGLKAQATPAAQINVFRVKFSTPGAHVNCVQGIKEGRLEVYYRSVALTNVVGTRNL